MNTKLLLKYIEGNATDQEKIFITNWLDSDPENMREFLALRKLYDITIWQSYPVSIKEQKNKENFSSWSWKPIYNKVLKIAAVILIAVLISRYLLPENNSQNSVAMQTIHVPAGQRAEITLVDGTKVWLNANTTFTFPNIFSGHSRNVTLDGEGFFEVTSNKSNPFIVKTNRYDIKVWGTKFNLTSYSGREIFETSLLEGSVEVLKSGSSTGIYIHPNERIFQDNDRLVVGSMLNTNHFLWREGIISFNDESFTELVSKLELYFDLKIDVKNDNILKYRCTGKFRTKDGIEHILKVLQLNNRFNFNMDEKTNTITID